MEYISGNKGRLAMILSASLAEQSVLFLKQFKVGNYPEDYRKQWIREQFLHMARECDVPELGASLCK